MRAKVVYVCPRVCREKNKQIKGCSGLEIDAGGKTKGSQQDRVCKKGV
jgi:hypothetical protein